MWYTELNVVYFLQEKLLETTGHKEKNRKIRRDGLVFNSCCFVNAYL